MACEKQKFIFGDKDLDDKGERNRHFAILREADLIQGDKQGNRIMYRLNITVLEEALLAMMDTFKIDLRGNNEPD